MDVAEPAWTIEGVGFNSVSVFACACMCACVRASVRANVCPSVGPSVRRSVGPSNGLERWAGENRQRSELRYRARNARAIKTTVSLTLGSVLRRTILNR